MAMTKNQKEWDNLIQTIEDNWKNAWILNEGKKYMTLLKKIRENTKYFTDIWVKDKFSTTIARIENAINGEIGYLERRKEKIIEMLKDEKANNSPYEARLLHFLQSKDFHNSLDFFVNILPITKDFSDYNIKIDDNKVTNLMQDTFDTDKWGNCIISKQGIINLDKYVQKQFEDTLKLQKERLAKFTHVQAKKPKAHTITMEEFEKMATSKYSGKRTRPHKKSGKKYGYLENSVRRMF